MKANELNFQLEHMRRINREIKDLNERIEYEKSDDSSNLRKSYENIQREIRFLLGRDYDSEH